MRPQFIPILILLLFWSCSNKDNQNFLGVQSVIEEKLQQGQEYSIFTDNFQEYLEEEYDLYNKYFHHLKTINPKKLSGENKTQMDRLNVELQAAMKKIDVLKVRLSNPTFYNPQKRIEQILNKDISQKNKEVELKAFLKNIPAFYGVAKDFTSKAKTEDWDKAIAIQKESYFYLKEKLPAAPYQFSAKNIEKATLQVKEFLAFCESQKVLQ